MLSQLEKIETFVSLRSGACYPETQVGDLMTIEPDGSATSKIPNERHVLSVQGAAYLQPCPCERNLVTAELSGRGTCLAYGTRLASSR